MQLRWVIGYTTLKLGYQISITHRVSRLVPKRRNDDNFVPETPGVSYTYFESVKPYVRGIERGKTRGFFNWHSL